MDTKDRFRTSLFIREDARGIGQPKETIPDFVPLIDVSLKGKIKYPKKIDISMLVIPARYAQKYPGLPIAKPGQPQYKQAELTLISRMMFGTAKIKIPDQIAFLLQQENLEEIRRNNALIDAEEEEKTRKSKGAIY